MEQTWFEMSDVRKRRLNNAAWIPLRETVNLLREGEIGYVGYREEFYGVGTVAVPVEMKAEAEKLRWMDIGIAHQHAPYVGEDGYVPADVYESHRGGLTGIHLVLEQRGNSLEHREWHLHHDLVLGLALKREGDTWLAFDEGYLEVARLRRDADGKPILLEMRTEHLKDFLAARGVGLFATTYRSRRFVSDAVGFIHWPGFRHQESRANERLECRVSEIHEGGFFPYGSRTAVFHVRHKNVDTGEDVPSLPHPTEGEFESDSWEVEPKGRKLYLVSGELWKDEWIEPGSKSPRVRQDEVPSSVRFIVDTEGHQLGAEDLMGSGRWLWFRPDVIMALAHRRGGHLDWYTRDTGAVSATPCSGVHFGVNQLGFVTVYAKDVALLDEWEQRIWAGHNVGPDGGVAAELLASQVAAEPAPTQAPEAFLGPAIAMLRSSTFREFGKQIVREHEQLDEIVRVAHRFRAVDRTGLFALAKDLARITADTIDAPVIHEVLSLPKNDRPGSLKSMERLLATRIDAKDARDIMGPLVGIYELRHADAHLPSSDTDDALELARIDTRLPLVHQGYQLLYQCVGAIARIVDAFTSSAPGAADPAST